MNLFSFRMRPTIMGKEKVGNAYSLASRVRI